jgi:hypothetical protein
VLQCQPSQLGPGTCATHALNNMPLTYSMEAAHDLHASQQPSPTRGSAANRLKVQLRVFLLQLQL